MAVEKIFFEIGIVIMLGTALAFAAGLLRQPLIIAYVITGLILGPVTGLVRNSDMIVSLSHLGVAFLLFLVGLEIDIRKLKSVGVPSAITGLGQVVISSTIGFIVLLLLGFTRVESMYLALAMSFSSTMIVVKLLSDKQELDTLHGRMLVGILLVQDVIAIFSLMLIHSIGQLSAAVIAVSVLKGVALFAVAFLSGRFVLPPVFRMMARSQELLFMAAVSWCFSLAFLASYFGYSLEIGAFLAGVSLASLSYSLQIIGRVKSLRDFFVTIFFVSLGLQITLQGAGDLLLSALILSGIVVILNPLAVMVIMSILGYAKKVSFLSSIAISQISEFSLILVALGVGMGLKQEILSLLSLVALITITIASYSIKYNSQLWGAASRFLSIFPNINLVKMETEHMPPEFKPDIILCGQDRIGYSIYQKLRQLKKKFLVVDYNPEVIKGLVREQVPCIYGDIGDDEIFGRLNIQGIELIISTAPDARTSSLILRKVKELNRRAIIIVTAYHIDDAVALYEEGADYVIMPHFLGGDYVSFLLEQFKDLNAILQTRILHIHELEKRKRLGHEHPK